MPLVPNINTKAEHQFFEDHAVSCATKKLCLLLPSDSITMGRNQLQLVVLNRALREKLPEYELKSNKIIICHNSAVTQVIVVVQIITAKSLAIEKMYANRVPKILRDEQKVNRRRISALDKFFF